MYYTVHLCAEFIISKLSVKTALQLQGKQFDTFRQRRHRSLLMRYRLPLLSCNRKRNVEKPNWQKQSRNIAKSYSLEYTCLRNRIAVSACFGGQQLSLRMWILLTRITFPKTTANSMDRISKEERGNIRIVCKNIKKCTQELFLKIITKNNFSDENILWHPVRNVYKNCFRKL